MKDSSSKYLCDGLAWLGFWIAVGLMNFQTCSAPETIKFFFGDAFTVSKDKGVEP